MKTKFFWLVVVIIIFFDQFLKIYIKLNYYLGEETFILGNWFRIKFIENQGMAYGLELGQGNLGKIILTSARLLAVIIGFFLIRKFLKKNYPLGFYIFIGCIYAGAIGNLIDSLFYGVLFSDSPLFMFKAASFLPEAGGYAPLFLGKVVDMLYFPLFTGQFPSWLPWLGGQDFLFFNAIFNVSDAAITSGVLGLWIFQRKLLKSKIL